MTSKELNQRLNELDKKYGNDRLFLINLFYKSQIKFKKGDWLQQ